MKTNLQKLLFTIAYLLCSIGVYAHDFKVDGIYYNILSSTEVEVSYRGSSSDSYDNEYKGSVVIPASITYNGTTYSVTSIGNYAFSGCTGLTSITIPNSVTSIGNYAFYDCTGLTQVTIPNSVTSIGGGAFYHCKGLTEVTIPNSVTSIGYSAFAYCKGLTSVIIPNSVTLIDNDTFCNCTGLTSITIPNSVTSIGGVAFSYCTGLTEVTIPNSVTSIGTYAFLSCESLQTVTIGSAVTEIGKNAFDGCDRIKTVNSYAEVPPTIYSNTFTVYTNDNATLHVVKGYKEAYAEADYWEYFVNITDDLRSVNYVDPELLQLDKEKITAYVGNTIEVLATLSPDNVTEKCVTWSVSDSTILEIAKVNDLSIEVLVLKEGVANIVATSVDGSELTATCEVTVEATLATSITLDQTAVTLKATETATLTATVLPETTTNKEVVWTSSNSEVASVENGIVTAHKVGTATITATTTDGSNLTATCEVTVEATLATSITLDQTNITAMEGETVVLTATIYPDDATEKGVVWSVSDATIATIEPLNNVSAKVTVLREGVVTITAETIDGSNLSATCTIDVYSDIEALLRDSEDVEYYDLNGFRVENPTRGIYIVKHGDIVRKVFVNKAR